jgi:hypothetical protein
MRTYPSLPRPLIEGWFNRNETLAPARTVGFHYHDVEEWLEGTRGQITFFTLQDGGQGYVLKPGGVLHIPRGEVHRAEAGPDGVDYRMHLPIAVPDGFPHPLSPDEIELLRLNLKFPLREENHDGCAAEFLAPHLSDALVFGRADGAVVGKETYLAKFKAMGRKSSGTVCVLNRKPASASAPHDSLLLSTVVTVEAKPPEPSQFTNLRLFLREHGSWKCRMWVNFPGSP